MTFTNKRFLITGASGFLGHALVRRLYKENQIVALARNEGNLMELNQQFPGIEIITGSVTSPSVCLQAVQGVHGVFHLAAFKHVRMAEEQPKECVGTNVIGSSNLLHALHSTGSLAQFILGISTDKAAQVVGVYGATKLLMEGLFRQWSEFTAVKHRIVRYGNVLYSTGSVLCKWKHALENGQEIVITDPEATRFYWTVDQAVDLMFECLEKATGPEPYCPTMKSMRVGDILEAMQAKYGKAADIRQIGIQPGENLHERLLENGPTSNEVERYSVREIEEMVCGTRKHRGRAFYAALDWQKQDCILAEETGTHPSDLHRWRKSLGMPKAATHYRRNSFPMEHKYDSADWTKQDARIAEEFGVSRERIRQVRNKLGKPKSQFHRKHRQAVSAEPGAQLLAPHNR